LVLQGLTLTLINRLFPLQVDLILGMANPAGSVGLIWQHTKTLRWCGTTIIVLSYLIINIIGRLSVTLFGFTFDINEEGGNDPPIMVSNWAPSEDWSFCPQVQPLEEEQYNGTVWGLPGDFYPDRFLNSTGKLGSAELLAGFNCR